MFKNTSIATPVIFIISLPIPTLSFCYKGLIVRTLFKPATLVRFCLLLLVLGCWLFGVVCRFVDVDGGDTVDAVEEGEEGEGGLRHSTVRFIGVWYLTFSWSLFQSQSIEFWRLCCNP